MGRGATGSLISFELQDNGAVQTNVGATPGLNAGFGLGYLGADAELELDKTVNGGSVSVSLAAWGFTATPEAAIGTNGAYVSLTAGLGGILGLGSTVEHVSGYRLTIGATFFSGNLFDGTLRWDPQNLTSIVPVSETSVGLGFVDLDATTLASDGNRAGLIDRFSSSPPEGPHYSQGNIQEHATNNPDGLAAAYQRALDHGTPRGNRGCGHEFAGCIR